MGSSISPTATITKGRFISVPCASDITPFKAFALPKTITACLNESSTNFLEFSSSVKEKAKNKAMQVNASNKSLFQLFIINVFMEAIIAD